VVCYILQVFHSCSFSFRFLFCFLFLFGQISCSCISVGTGKVYKTALLSFLCPVIPCSLYCASTRLV
jgi:hypothetical protein